MRYYDFTPRIKTSLHWRLTTKIYEEAIGTETAIPAL